LQVAGQALDRLLADAQCELGSLERALQVHKNLMASEGGGVGKEPFITDGFHRNRKASSKLELGLANARAWQGGAGLGDEAELIMRVFLSGVGENFIKRDGEVDVVEDMPREGEKCEQEREQNFNEGERAGEREAGPEGERYEGFDKREGKREGEHKEDFNDCEGEYDENSNADADKFNQGGEGNRESERDENFGECGGEREENVCEEDFKQGVGECKGNREGEHKEDFNDCEGERDENSNEDADEVNQGELVGDCEGNRESEHDENFSECEGEREENVSDEDFKQGEREGKGNREGEHKGNFNESGGEYEESFDGGAGEHDENFSDSDFADFDEEELREFYDGFGGVEDKTEERQMADENTMFMRCTIESNMMELEARLEYCTDMADWREAEQDQWEMIQGIEETLGELGLGSNGAGSGGDTASLGNRVQAWRTQTLYMLDHKRCELQQRQQKQQQHPHGNVDRSLQRENRRRRRRGEW